MKNKTDEPLPTPYIVRFEAVILLHKDPSEIRISDLLACLNGQVYKMESQPLSFVETQETMTTEAATTY